VGSWDAVYELAKKDKDGNASRGDLVIEGSRGNYVDAGKTVALVGVENLIVIDTPDALLEENEMPHRCRMDQRGKSMLRA
jgi:mannose-1-phosphate guanylyltransferase